MRSPLRPLRLVALIGVILVGRAAVAGDMLTPALLVKQANAVAIVDNPLNSSIAVRRWIGAEPTLPVQLSSPLCVPDKDMLQRWQKTHPKHAGASTWAKTLSVGHIDQVVFLQERKGVLVPFCETEVMNAQAFSTHPDYKAYVVEVEGLVRGAAPVAAPVEAAPVDAAPVAAVGDAAPVAPAVAPVVVAPVVVDKGCW